MAQFKQFGDVILNLDRVVKVEKREDRTVVHLSGIESASPKSTGAVALIRGQSKGRQAMGATEEFSGAMGDEVWTYFTGQAGN